MIGRGGKTGIATTLITPSQPELVLKDLKHLLVEAKQKVPEFLSLQQKRNLWKKTKNSLHSQECVGAHTAVALVIE